MATVQFGTISDGTSQVDLSAVTAYDISGNGYPLSTTNGRVLFAAPGWFVAPSSQSTSASTASVDIAITSESDLAAYQFTLTWDAFILTFVSVTNRSLQGSTGRTVFCASPALDANTLTFGCIAAYCCSTRA